MPIACDPERRVAFSLTLDKAEQGESAPIFYARFITCRQRMRMVELNREAIDADSDADGQAKVLEALSIILTGWEKLVDQDNRPVPFEMDRLLDVLTDIELWELFMASMAAVRMEERELKKSASQSLSGSAESAEDAAPDIA